jgi:ketosteroid isomerase-like protein
MGAVDEVLAAQARKFAAKVARDLATLDELLADDLVYIHASGKVDDKPAFLKAVRSRGYLGFARRQAEARLFGDVAVVTGLADIHVHETLRFDAMFTDVWVKCGTWKNVAWQSTIVKPA